MRAIELSAPARDLACGIAAIDAGADAVYIGARRFGARRSAGNPAGAIRELADYAHRFRARVYVALNTILYDEELEEARLIVRESWEAGADALIVQDMGILEMDLPPIPLFASTQTDNRDWRRVKFLGDVGFRRVILARELSLPEIREIRARTAVELECFAAGALCAGVSGQCWFSLAVCGRSANRGDCAQPCRGRYDVEDPRGKTIERGRHPLSLKDLDLSRRLRELVDAGVASFKIEGRLKDAAYAANLTAHFRRALDRVIASDPSLRRASAGETAISWEPDPAKTFNRGLTEYRIDGTVRDAASPLTRKSIGKAVGRATAARGDSFSLEGGAALRPGDGVCLFDRRGVLRGSLVAAVAGGRIRLRDAGIVRDGAVVHRNLDRGFLAALERRPAERKMAVRVEFEETPGGFRARAFDERGVGASVETDAEKLPARSMESAVAAARAQFGRLGGTPYALAGIGVRLARPRLLRAAVLNRMRRELVAGLDAAAARSYRREERSVEPNGVPFPGDERDHRLNVSNRLARRFYARHGAAPVESALELRRDLAGKTVLTARSCVRMRLGICPREAGAGGAAEPLFLADAHRRYRLDFDCAECAMRVVFLG